MKIARVSHSNFEIRMKSPRSMFRLAISALILALSAACDERASLGKADPDVSKEVNESARAAANDQAIADEESNHRSRHSGNKSSPNSTTAPSNAASSSASGVSDGALVDSYLSGATSAESGATTSLGRDHHIAFESEPRDASWADFVEPRLRFYLAGQQGSSNFNVTSLQCRSSMCEVLAVNRSSQGTENDTDRWQSIIFSMKRERWFAEAQIQEPMMEFGIVDNGRVAILTYLIRK